MTSNSLLGAPAWAWLCAFIILIGQTLSETRAVRLQLEEHFIALAAWQVAPQILRSATVILLAASGLLTGSNALFGYAMAAVIVAAVSFSSLMKMAKGNVKLASPHDSSPFLHQPTATPGISECFKSALPYSLVTLFFLIYSLGILAMVDLLIGKEAAAFYNVSYLIFTSLCILPSVVYTKYMAAKIFRWWANDRQMLIASFHLGISIHLILGVVLGAGVAFCAPLLIPLLFGATYQPAVAVLQILAFAVPIRFIQHGYGAVLFSKEHIRRKVSYMGLTAILSALLMLALTPQFGVRGAAASAVLSELVLLLLYVLAAMRHVDGINVTATFRWATLVAAHKYATGQGKDA